MANNGVISRAVIQRLPRYYRHIVDLQHEGVQRISSRLLAERLGLTASQIRQDFNCFGGFGQQGYGYNVEKLKGELADILGLSDKRTAILVGVGNLGRALLHNFDFTASGFTVLAAFDNDSAIIGQQIGALTIEDVQGMEAFIERQKPDIAVLTLARAVAPSVAKQLADKGLRGFWNFTGEDLHLEGLGVPVENVHLSDSLMMLCHQID